MTDSIKQFNNEVATLAALKAIRETCKDEIVQRYFEECIKACSIAVLDENTKDIFLQIQRVIHQNCNIIILRNCLRDENIRIPIMEILNGETPEILKEQRRSQDRKAFAETWNSKEKTYKLTTQDQEIMNQKYDQSTIDAFIRVMCADYELFESTYKYDDGEDELILITANIPALDKYWAMNDDFYLPPYDKLMDNDKYKYIQKRGHILNINPNEQNIPPQIGFYDDDMDIIDFTDGRNRFANLRDMGAKTIPIIIYTGDLSHFQRLNIVS